MGRPKREVGGDAATDGGEKDGMEGLVYSLTRPASE